MSTIYRDRDGNVCEHKTTKVHKSQTGGVKIEVTKCKKCPFVLERKTINAETGKVISIDYPWKP